MQIRIKQIFCALSFLSLIFAPAVSLAVTNSNSTTSNFCTKISSIGSEVANKLMEFGSDSTQKSHTILVQLQQRKDKVASAILVKRDDEINGFETSITKLLAKANTDAEKAAIQTFKTSVETAMTQRQTTVDNAVLTYNNAVKNLVSQREDSLTTSGSNFQTNVTAAVTKAQSDCTAGISSTTVRASFLASLKSANQKFHSNLQVDKVGQQSRL